MAMSGCISVTLGILAVAGLMLFLRPVKNIRWAALVALVVGIFASYYAYRAERMRKFGSDWTAKMPNFKNKETVRLFSTLDG